jgi:predicted nucleic acid-binding protein
VKISGRKELNIVLDTNVCLFALTETENSPSVILFNRILISSPVIHLHIPRTILNEIRRKISAASFKKLLTLVRPVASLDEDGFIPYELGEKYAAMNLKPADALIAAYTEWIKADMLVSENRHFLARKPNLPFKVLTAFQFLKLL